MSSLTDDLDAILGRVRAATPAALRYVGEQLTSDLKLFIDAEIYEGDYQPSSYPRRKDNPRFGPSLDSDENFTVISDSATLIFTYNPSGEHSGRMKDALDYKESAAAQPGNELDGGGGNAPLKPSPNMGNSLIAVIETGAKAYDWNTEVPPRPFYTDFLEHEFVEERIVDAFIYAVNQTDPTIKMTRGADKELTGYESAVGVMPDMFDI